MAVGLERARAVMRKACALARDGRPEALESCGALLESESASLRAFVPALAGEMDRLQALAGQAAAFYARCLEPGGGISRSYTARGAAADPPVRAALAAEG